MDPLPTRIRLLAAAAAVFVQEGFDGASMEVIRQRAGVSNGSLYHHFPTKAELADQLYAHTLRDLHGRLLMCIAGKVRAESGVKSMIRAFVAWVLQHPDEARLLHELRRGSQLEAGGAWSAANREGFAALADWVNRMTQAGEMRPMPFPIWFALVFAPVISLAPYWVGKQAVVVTPRVRTALEHGAWASVAP